MVVELTRLLDEHPVLYHMAEDGTWPSIREHGLFSTKALVDRLDLESAMREEILCRIRRSSIRLSTPDMGTVVVRDQGPLKFLDAVLEPDTSRQEFLDILNGRVFFWASHARLLKLLGARRYRSHYQVVLHVDTRKLLTAHPEAELAALNTGSAHVPTAPRRGRGTFQSIADYPYNDWRKRRGRTGDALVEVTVPDAVPNIAAYVLRVERWHAGAAIELLHDPGAA